MCSNVGLCVWVLNVIVYCITELCYFLMKFSGNNNAVGLKKKPQKIKAFCSCFSSQGLTLSLLHFTVSSSSALAFKSGTT